MSRMEDTPSNHQLLGAITDLATAVGEGFTRAEARTDARFDRVETRLDHVETRLDRLEMRVSRLDTRVDEGFEKIDKRLIRLERPNHRRKD
jgi:chaperonin cofactor prefoldin